jgi:hypothetical protein
VVCHANRSPSQRAVISLKRYFSFEVSRLPPESHTIIHRVRNKISDKKPHGQYYYRHENMHTASLLAKAITCTGGLEKRGCATKRTTDDTSTTSQQSTRTNGLRINQTERNNQSNYKEESRNNYTKRQITNQRQRHLRVSFSQRCFVALTRILSGTANTHSRKYLLCRMKTTASNSIRPETPHDHFSDRTKGVCVVPSDPSRPSPPGCCASLDRSSATPRS